jgi:chromosome partitioning protein
LAPRLPVRSNRPVRVLSLVNQKGGCGKTTAAINLAASLVARGARVLLVDLDPQAHATLGLSHDSGRDGVAEVLLGARDARACLVAAPGGIALLPGSQRLAEFEEVAVRELAPAARLAAALAELGEEFDHVLLDCPARADGLLAASALVASDVALLVIETGAFALQGAIRALRLLEAAGERHGARFEVRVLATLFDRRTRFARELLIALHARFGERMFETVIRSHVRLREAAACGVPVRLLDPRGPAAVEFEALAAEVAAAGPPPRERAVEILPAEPLPGLGPRPARPRPVAATPGEAPGGSRVGSDGARLAPGAEFA